MPPGPLHVVALASGEDRRLSLPDGLRPRTLSWFPDGVHLLVASAAGLHRLSVLGGAPELVRAGDVKSGAVSPDGARVAYTSEETLWIMDGDRGAPPRRLAENTFPGDPLPLAWGPGGRRVAYVLQRRGAAPEIRTVGAETGDVVTVRREVRLQLDVSTSYLTWTPDGRLLYTLREDDGTSVWAVKVDPASGRVDGEPARRKLFVAATAMIGNAAADGTVAVVPVSNQADIFVGELGAGSAPLRRFTSDVRDDDAIGFTEDGSDVLFFSKRRGGPALFRQPFAGGDATLLARGGEDFQGALAPDGAHVLFRRPAPGATRLLRVPVGGGAAEELFDLPLPAGTSMFSSRIRCGRAGCVAGIPTGGRLSMRRFTEAGLGEEIRSLEQHGAWDLDAEGQTLIVSEALSGALTTVAVADGAMVQVGVADCPPQHIRWARERSLLFTCTLPSPSLRLRAADGRTTTLWSGDETPSLIATSRDGRRVALGLQFVTGNVWLLEGM